MRAFPILGIWMGLILVLGLGAAPAPSAGDRYELRVKLEPERQRLEANLGLAARLPAGAKEGTWLLNRQMEVLSLQGPLVATWTFDREAASAPAGVLKVQFRRPLGPTDRVQFRVRYQGTLASWPEHGPNLFTPGWTELGRSSYWFPVRQNAEPFTFRLEVQCKPDYGLVSYGPLKPANGLRTLEWNQPVTDLVLVAAPAKRLQILNPSARVRLVDTEPGGANATRLAQAMGELMASLRKRLGLTEAGAMTLVLSQRQDGGNTTGPGFLVVPGMTETGLAQSQEDLLQRLALNTARVWWNKAPAATWDDWLNVSFSEYSALVSLRDVAGEPSFQRRIEAKRRACVGLPPLWEFDRGGPNAQALMETKGVILLAELEVFVGRPRFGAFCQELAAQKALRTSTFLDLLEARAGKAVREAFQRRIMTL